MGITDEIRALRVERGDKGISHHPELRYRYHILSQQAGQQVVDDEMQSYVDYASVFQSYVWVHKAISVISKSISSLPVNAVDKNEKVLSAHPLSELFAYVNDSMSPSQLWGSWTVHMFLGGESFLELVPDGRRDTGIAEIWPRRPDKVAILPDESRKNYPRPAAYLYGDNPTGEDAEEFGLEEVIHDRFFNPLSDWRGLAPIAAVRSGVVIDLYSQAWSRSFLRRGGRPDWALIAPEGLTPTEREEYEMILMDKFAGPDNWHKPIVLEKGITDVKPLSHPPKDIEWLEQRKFSRDEVGGLFGVPDEVMGFGRDTYENMPAAHRWFWMLTLVPLIDHRDTTLTSFFRKTRPMLKPGERIKTDLSRVLALQEDLKPKVEMAKELWGMGVPFNVVDDHLGLGIGPIPGGNVAYLPLMMMPVGEERESGKNGSPRQWRGWRPATKQAAVPDYGSPRHKALWKAAVALFLPYERRMKQKLDTDFAKQQAAVLDALKGEKSIERILGRWKESKQDNEVPMDVDDFFDLEEWTAYFSVAFEPLFTDVTRAAGQASLTGFGLDSPFDLGNPRVQRAIRMMKIKFADDINQTTQRMMGEALRGVLMDADEQGWGIPRIQEEIYSHISEVFDVRRTPYERERIARTEMHKASEMGNQEGAWQSGLDLLKAWLTALDGRERDSHREAHLTYQQDPIPLDSNFVVGGDLMKYPGGGSAPEEIINCRCTVMYLEVEAES